MKCLLSTFDQTHSFLKDQYLELTVKLADFLDYCLNTLCGCSAGNPADKMNDDEDIGDIVGDNDQLEIQKGVKGLGVAIYICFQAV